MPITSKCQQCEAKFSAPDKYAGKAVKCPKCGGRIMIPSVEEDPEEPDVQIVEDDEYDDDYGAGTNDDGLEGDYGSDEDYGTDEDYGDDEYYGDDTDYGDDNFDYVDDYGEATVPVPKKSSKPKSSTSKKKKKKKKSKKKRSSGQSVGSVMAFVVGFIGAFKVYIFGGLTVIGLIVALIYSGVISTQTEKRFVAAEGDPRTTSEWLELVGNYERDQAEGVTISSKRMERYRKVADNIENCLGPDPAALPAILNALKDDSQANYRCRRMAETVLGKFVTSTEKPYYSDIKGGLASSHPKVVLWSVRLVPRLGEDGSGLKSRVEELAKSDDADIAAAAQKTLAAMSG